MTEATAPDRPRGGAALVTGGAKRIGRAICLELAAAGFDVAIHHRDSDAEAAEIVTELAEIAAAMGVDLRAMASRVSADLRETETEAVDPEPVPAPRNSLPN